VTESPTPPSSAGQAEPEASGPPEIPRWKVEHRLLSRFDDPRYLEVGVNRGQTFHRVRAAELVAVDPDFLFDHEAEAKQRPNATYHSMTSDEYFGSVIGADELFDVIFLDGLHTFEQTLRDLLNALDHLAPRGVIVIDDVRPPFYDASLPDHDTAVRVRDIVGQTKQVWMGDVYRLIWFIDTFLPNLSYRTTSNNHGQAVVWRQQRPSVTERTVRSIAELSFEDYLLTPDVLRLRTFYQIFKELKPVIGRGFDPSDDADDEEGADALSS
jgi:SAM-dependent methyltransferase